MRIETDGLHDATSIATDELGFTRDESITELGTELTLPSWPESDRDMPEQRLPALESASVTDTLP